MLEIREIPIHEIHPATYNPRKDLKPGDPEYDSLARMINSPIGLVEPLVWNERTGNLVGGHQRLKILTARGDIAATCSVVRLSDEEERTLNIALNKLGGAWDETKLSELLNQLKAAGSDLGMTGYSDSDLEAMMLGLPSGRSAAASAKLSERFGIPPFSVLNAREGWWQDRKRAWVGLGIESELGRGAGGATPPHPPTITQNADGTLNYGGTEGQAQRFDGQRSRRANAVPGGSLMPAVSKKTGKIVRSDSRARPMDSAPIARVHVESLAAVGEPVGPLTAGRPDASDLGPGGITSALPPILDPAECTPIQAVEALAGGLAWLKRNDLFRFGGTWGDKGRALIRLLAGARGCTTAGNRRSPMVSRVARAAEALGLPARCHCARSKEMTDQVRDAREHGAEVIQHKVAYLTALVGKAKADAKEHGYVFVPLGVECQEYLDATVPIFENLLEINPARYVITVGSGMALASLLRAFDVYPEIRRPVLGVVVGGEPSIATNGRVTRLLDLWTPGWYEHVRLECTGTEFDDAAEVVMHWGVPMDPHYEAKTARYVQAGDCMVVVACRSTAFAARGAD